MSYTFENPFAYFNNPANSNPVGLGRLYVGLIDTDPVAPANQVQVYAVQPDGSELAIPQPVVLLAGGVPSYNGAPIQLKVNAEQMSVKVTTSTGVQSYYTARWSAGVSATELGTVDSNALVGGVEAGDLGRRYTTTIFATDYMPAGSVDIAVGIQGALSATQAAGLKAVQIVVTPRRDSLYWAWGSEVNISADSWVDVCGQGYVPVKATQAMRSFAILGVSNKLNASKFHGFSFNAGGFNHTCAVWVSASRALDVYDIETKADPSGSFVDAVYLDDSNNTSGEVGSGFELNSVKNIFDSGDSAVTRSMVRVASATVSVTIDQIRATRENFQSAVSSASTATMNGGKISNILGTFPTVRAVKVAALVDLQGSISGVAIAGVTTLDGGATPSVERGVRLSNPVGLPALNSIDNVTAKYTVKNIDVDIGFLLTRINGTYTNGGVPGKSGITALQPQLTPRGGTFVDTENRSVWVENNGFFVPAFDRRLLIIPDDFAAFIPTSNADAQSFGSQAAISVESGAVYSGVFYWRTAFVTESAKMYGGTNLAVQTGVLTGTTGLDGNVTVSADEATGGIYIENRSGTSRRFILAFLS